MRLFGLAPGGVCRAAPIAGRAGGLLHRRFTLACAGCPAIGGLLSVALSVAPSRMRPGVTWQPVQGARTFLGGPQADATVRPVAVLREI